MFAVGFPAAPDTAMSVRAYGRQTSQPPAAWAAAALSAVRPLRVRISLALTPALRSFSDLRLGGDDLDALAPLSLRYVEAHLLQLTELLQPLGVRPVGVQPDAGRCGHGDRKHEKRGKRDNYSTDLHPEVSPPLNGSPQLLPTQ